METKTKAGETILTQIKKHIPGFIKKLDYETDQVYGGRGHDWTCLIRRFMIQWLTDGLVLELEDMKTTTERLTSDIGKMQKAEAELRKVIDERACGTSDLCRFQGEMDIELYKEGHYK
jgi:hypothetical protein